MSKIDINAYIKEFYMNGVTLVLTNKFLMRNLQYIVGTANNLA